MTVNDAIILNKIQGYLDFVNEGCDGEYYINDEYNTIYYVELDNEGNRLYETKKDCTKEIISEMGQLGL